MSSKHFLNIAVVLLLVTLLLVTLLVTVAGHRHIYSVYRILSVLIHMFFLATNCSLA